MGPFSQLGVYTEFFCQDDGVFTLNSFVKKMNGSDTSCLEGINKQISITEIVNIVLTVILIAICTLLLIVFFATYHKMAAVLSRQADFFRTGQLNVPSARNTLKSRENKVPTPLTLSRNCAAQVEGAKERDEELQMMQNVSYGPIC